LENTKNHTNSNSVDLYIKYENDKVVLLYKDSGILMVMLVNLVSFSINIIPKRIWNRNLFNKKLLGKMKALLIIESKGSLVFKIIFQVPRDEYA